MRRKKSRWLTVAQLAFAIAACGKTATLPSASRATDAGIDSGWNNPDEPTDAASEGAQPDATRPPEASDASIEPANVDAQWDGPEDAGEDAAQATDSADSSSPVPCDETSTCATPVQLPTLWGGVTAGINEETNLYGEHSDWYVVEVQPYPPPASSGSQVNVQVTIQPPPGMEFDLDVYASTSLEYPGTCGTAVGSSTGAGIQQDVKFSFPNTHYDVLGWITVHVIAKQGEQCSTGARYWLEVSTAN